MDTEADKYICLICLEEFENCKRLAVHLQYRHSIRSKDYVVQHYYNNKEPLCSFPSCYNVTRYVAMNGVQSFKKYCKDHAKEAMREGGHEGGQKPSWNKGKTKNTDIRVYNQSIAMSGNANHFFGKRHSEDNKKKIAERKLIPKDEFDARTSLRSNEFECVTSYSEYGSRQYTKLKFKCQKCSKIQTKTLQSYERGSLCKFCYPKCISQAEIELGNFLENDLGCAVTRNAREVIPPLELDMYLSERKIAIEYNGLYWHDALKVGKGYHREKTRKCSEAGIQLIHVYSDEWMGKKEIIKSMLSAKLGLTKTSVDGRKCSIKEIDTSIAKAFFSENHISGHAKCMKVFGLYNSANELVSCMSFRLPGQKQEWLNANSDVVELARYANKQATVVRGGFSKLLQYAIKNWIVPDTSYRKIWSYCDLGYGTGNVYEKSGFSLSTKQITTNYWYTDGKKRYNRFKFRASDGLSEAEVAKKNKVWKVYGSGNMLFIYEIKT